MQSDLSALEDSSGQAVVVIGHGSRAPNSGGPLQWLVAELAAVLGCRVVPAFLQFNQPSLTEACRDLACSGARHILIAPYFLFEGNHIRQDIPEEISQLQVEFPGVTFSLAAALGTDELLVELVKKRLTEAGLGMVAQGSQPQEQHPIERESFAIIDRLTEPDDPDDPSYMVARRVVHATGDISLVRELRFSPGAISAAIRAMARGATILCDVNMVLAGVEPTARQAGLRVVCGIASEEAGKLAAAEGISRSAAAFRCRYSSDSTSFDGAIVVVGNAPTALFEVLRLVREEGIRPALVIGVPVGFVGAAESKEELAAARLEYITLPGTRGGSNVAAAICNALMRLGQQGEKDGQDQ